MLTQQHRFASEVLNPDYRHSYRLHMCGLCHALGDGYGLLSRWLGSYDLILLNLLCSAQMPAAPPEVLRTCPLNPFMKVRTNPGPASDFAAHIGVNLAQISVADDVQDSGDWRARILNFWLKKPQARALSALEDWGFDAETLRGLNGAQSQAESHPELDPSQPTAQVSAAIFRMTASLAGQSQNESALAQIGASYGAYLYWMDAYRDFPQDWLKGEFNPLLPYLQKTEDVFGLSQEGAGWLKTCFEGLLQAIESGLEGVKFGRYGEQIQQMLTDPLRRAIASLQDPPRYKKTGHPIQAALFLLPLASLPDVEVSEDELKREKRQTQLGECAYCGVWGADGACDLASCCAYTSCETCSQAECGDSGGCDGTDSCDVSGCDCNCN